MSNGRTSQFLEEVKQWCKANEITQTALARKLGISTSLVTEWFKGRRFPVAEEVLHLQQLMAIEPQPAKGNQNESDPNEYPALMQELSRWCRQRGRQSLLAKRLGISRQTINTWINGSRRPSVDLYLDLKEFLRRQRNRDKRQREE